MKRTLKHAYIKEGEEFPCDPRRDVLHIAERNSGTGLDVWWLDWEDE